MPEFDSKEEVFVRLTDSVELRKDILESAKTTAHILKNFEKLNFICKQKKKESFKLNLVFSEIKSLMNSMNLREVAGSESKQEKKVIFSKKEDKAKQKPKDKLSLDLEEIERKLNSLKF